MRVGEWVLLAVREGVFVAVPARGEDGGQLAARDADEAAVAVGGAGVGGLGFAVLPRQAGERGGDGEDGGAADHGHGACGGGAGGDVGGGEVAAVAELEAALLAALPTEEEHDEEGD